MGQEIPQAPGKLGLLLKAPAQLKLIKTVYRPEELPFFREVPVLFLGRSNVGKSSLLNSLGVGDRAQISKQPGKTRSINFFKWGKALMLVDLPGYGYAKRSKKERQEWGDLVRAFMDQLPPHGLAFLLMDCRRNLEEEEIMLLNSLAAKGLEVLVLFTKADRMSQSERQKRKKEIQRQWQEAGWQGRMDYLFTSVKSREGLKEIFSLLNYYGEKKDLPASSHDQKGSQAGP